MGIYDGMIWGGVLGYSTKFCFRQEKRLYGNPVKPCLFYGAGGRGRTGMPSRALDFESSASTNFTTPANSKDYIGSPVDRQ